jgi:hypothetical protein
MARSDRDAGSRAICGRWRGARDSGAAAGSGCWCVSGLAAGIDRRAGARGGRQHGCRERVSWCMSGSPRASNRSAWPRAILGERLARGMVLLIRAIGGRRAPGCAAAFQAARAGLRLGRSCELFGELVACGMVLLIRATGRAVGCAAALAGLLAAGVNSESQHEPCSGLLQARLPDLQRGSRMAVGIRGRADGIAPLTGGRSR